LRGLYLLPQWRLQSCGRKKRACCSYGNEMRDQDNRKVARNHKAFVFLFVLMSTSDPASSSA
jgi:hypothetical protein